MSNLAFFTQGRLSVGTVVPDGPFFRNAEDSVPYGVRFGFPRIKGRLTLRVLGYPSSVFSAKGRKSTFPSGKAKRNGQDRSLRCCGKRAEDIRHCVIITFNFQLSTVKLYCPPGCLLSLIHRRKRRSPFPSGKAERNGQDRSLRWA